MATAKEFYELWTRDRKLREQGCSKAHHNRFHSKGAIFTRRKQAFDAIRRELRKLES